MRLALQKPRQQNSPGRQRELIPGRRELSIQFMQGFENAIDYLPNHLG